MYEIKSWRLLSQKVVIGIDIDDIGILKDLLKVEFINGRCENLKVVIDDGKRTRNIKQKEKSDILQDLYSYKIFNL